MLSHRLNKILGVFFCVALISPVISNAYEHLLQTESLKGNYKVTFSKLKKTYTLIPLNTHTLFPSNNTCRSGSLKLVSTQDPSKFCKVDYHASCHTKCIQIWEPYGCIKKEYVFNKNTHYTSIKANGLICQKSEDNQLLTVTSQ